MSARILVADDSVTIQKVVELTFSKEDFALTQARSGEEAIRKAREIRPDLVLLDLVMPDMNGYDVCTALRAEPSLRAVPIILLAGTFESFDRQRGMQVGANDFVTKPFESQVLIGKVKQLLFAKAMEAGGTGQGGRSAPDAVTVKIPPAAEPAAGPAPGPGAAPQEALWQLLGGSAPAAPAAATPAPAPPMAEPPTLAAPAAEPESSPLDMGSLSLEPLPPGGESAAAAMDVLPLPESLSLDDLLASGGESAGGLAPGPEEPVSLEPVFDLSDAEAPLLPMAEAEKGETPPVTEDLLASAVAEQHIEDTLTLELPEIDLAPVGGEHAPTDAVQEASVPSSADAFEPQVEPVMADQTGAGQAVGAPEIALTPSPEEQFPVGHETPHPADVSPPVSAVAAAVSSAAPLDVPAAEHAAHPSPVEVSAADMAAMKEAVTERVADEIRSELTEKLVERFEKIVWEVVPDLAEILITKEIERIRKLAEEERPS